MELMTLTKRPKQRLVKVGTFRVPGNKELNEWEDVTYFVGRHHKLGEVAYDRVRRHFTNPITGHRAKFDTWYLTYRGKNPTFQV